nr:unnamed protein product [Spirometra erinaceieuropaei]
MGNVHAVGPNEALVLSGGCCGSNRVRTVIGGWGWAWWCLTDVQRLSLSIMTLQPKCEDVETSEGVPVTVTGVAQVKVMTDGEFLSAACEQFLGRSVQDIKATILNTLEGHLRAILGTLSVESIYQDRDQFAALVREVAAPDVGRMGIEILSFTIKDLYDKVEYLDSLGRAQTANVMRDADIGVAEAERDAGIREAECNKKMMDTKFEADGSIADSKRKFELLQAEYQQEVNVALADSQLAYTLQAAKENQKIKAEEIEIEVALIQALGNHFENLLLLGLFLGFICCAEVENYLLRIDKDEFKECSEEDPGDRKPTQLLWRLEQLADGQKLDATMFKQLFLQRLPASVQAILAPNIPSWTAQMLAETADRILEYYQPPVTVNVASRSTTAPTIEDVVKRLDALTLEVSQLRATPVEAFNRAKKTLADTTVPVHPIPDAPLSIVADASNFAIGAALQQQTPTGTQPLAFYSAKLTPPQTRYSTFGRELLAIYLAIKHFRNDIEGRDFYIYTDYTPLTYALSTSSDKYSPREARHLDFISQYTTDIGFLKGLYNHVADCLSRPGINAITRPSIDLERMAELQNRPTFSESLQHTSLQLEVIPLSTTPIQSCVTYRAVPPDP